MRRTQKFALILMLATVSLMFLPAQSRSAHAEQREYWQVAAQINDLFFEAQSDLFAAGRAENPAEHFVSAHDKIEQADLLYQDALKADVANIAPDADTAIHTALTSALDAAQNGEGGALALARGQVWTNLLYAGYSGALTDLQHDNLAGAAAWLRLREFRPSTRLTLVADLAAQAVAALNSGSLDAEDAVLRVRNDLNDTYYFHLRDALNHLEDAASKNYGVRAAEYAGQLQGYAAILRDDMTAKLGEGAVSDLQTQVTQLQQHTLAQDWSAVQADIDAIRAGLTNYQPVEFSRAQIEERGRLLYLFISLIHYEYSQGVRNGEITAPIEIQEATTFREQAQAIFEELRPVMSQTDPTSADRLAELLAQMETTMQAVGEPGVIKSYENEALAIVEDALAVKVDLNDTESAFIVTKTLLDDLVTSVRAGRYDDAERTRLEAYGMLEAGTEKLIFAFDPQLGAEIEGLFWLGNGDSDGLATALADHRPADEIAAIRAELGKKMNEAQVLIGAGANEPNVIIFNTATIVFREGLEAVVILAALMASMVADRKKQRLPMVVGVGAALVATALTFWLAQILLSSLARFGQRLEAVVSLIAVVVLLVILNWFFHKLYWTGWMARFHRHKKKLVSAEVGQFLGLALLGFSSVYREGFETVLFLQALVLDAGVAVVLEGVALGMAGVIIVGVLAFKFQTRLPYKHMLIVTGVLILTVLFMMVGNTVHLLQAVGWLPITPIEHLNTPYWLGLWFGVFPTWQGIGLQFGAVAFVIGSYYAAEMLKHRKRNHRSAAPQRSMA
ncbi:MAG: iron permease [Chloroflexi bacterium]|nr:iron permease [Chloroflexota bacterium]